MQLVRRRCHRVITIVRNIRAGYCAEPALRVTLSRLNESVRRPATRRTQEKGSKVGEGALRTTRGTIRALLVTAAMTLVALAWTGGTARAATPAKTEWGYVAMPDGAKLRYTLWLPAGHGPFPTLMSYDGYSTGTDPSRANPQFTADMLGKGYAILGVNLRGSGCSDGTWQLFNTQQGQDGADMIEWAARQPWSTGRVAEFSYSYGGIMQLWVAAQRPKHLVAIGPGNPVTDTYRDIGFPGGIENDVFPPEWGASLNADWSIAQRNAIEQGDSYCAQNTARHLSANNLNTLAIQMSQHPFLDQWHHDHSVINWTKNIDVPVFAVQSWQDEETGPHGEADYLSQLDPRRTWLIDTNGHHEMFETSTRLIHLEEDYYDYEVKGIQNEFATMPHVQIWNETTTGSDPVPRSITYVNRLPVRVEEADIPLGPHGLESSTGNAGQTSYPYPVPSAAVVDGSGLYSTLPGQVNTWTSIPSPATGRAIFTTPRLANTITTYGPSSADLWVSTTAPDVDLQVTVTEVRPDGREMYVQRGWLRASDRALDQARSTDLTPWHPYTRAAAENMPSGRPQLLRVDMFPFSHTFRAGSSIRIYVEMPSVTGLWGFNDVLPPQTVTIHHDAAYPSRLVLGLLPHAVYLSSLPSCGTVHSEPCRTSPVPQPAGHLDVEPAAARRADRAHSRYRATRQSQSHRSAHKRHRHSA
jgi:putative CocE/NonD family hydrolase